MRIQTVARKCQVPDPVQARAREQIERLSRFDPNLQSAEIIFAEQRHRKSVEGILTRNGEPPAVAQGEGSEFRPALDQMLVRLQKILRRSRSQVTDHQGPKIADVMSADAVTEPGVE